MRGEAQPGEGHVYIANCFTLEAFVRCEVSELDAVHADPVYMPTVTHDVHVFFSASTETWLPGTSS